MAFRKSFIEYGDCVIVVTGKNETRSIHLTKDEVSQTRFGALRHNDCIGKPYGSKIATSRGHVHLLSLSPLLWSASLPHRTQIIYPADASLIVGFLDLAPGKRIFEAGTGSASLTHFLAQAILPTGYLTSFDFHAGRVEQAHQELQVHQLADVVSVMCRDVCSVGFPLCGEAENPEGVDAVMLDLPQPWSMVYKLPRVYRPVVGGRLCTFSPCFEQVQRTHLALNECGFINLKTVECLHRSYDVVRAVLNVPNMGQLDYSLAANDNSSGDGRHGASFLFPPPQTSTGYNVRTGDDDPGVKRGRKRTHDHGDKGHSPGRFTWEAMLHPQMPGHTGYLTFASWIPSKSSGEEQRTVCIPSSPHDVLDDAGGLIKE